MARASGNLVFHRSVEWSTKIHQVRAQLHPFATHFVLPNLPNVVTPEHEHQFFQSIPPHARICTIAACRHNVSSLRKSLANDDKPKVDKYLLVGGNGKGETSLTTVEAAYILRGETDCDVWGVANPNDPESPNDVRAKLDAGIQGIITQPFFTSRALDIFESYPRPPGISYVAGMAFPACTNELVFWLGLLGQSEILQDPLVCRHLEFFASKGKSAQTWVEKEHEILRDLPLVGIHFMPMKNVDALLALVKSLE